MSKKNFNRIITFFLVCIIILTTVAGCGKTEQKRQQSEKTKTPETRVVTDCLGRKVTIPYKVKSVVPLANALRLMSYADCLDLVVGVEEGEKEQTVLKAYNWVYYKTWQDMPVVGKGGSGGYTPFIEEIVGANPDVIICGYAQKDAEDLQNKTGIPVVVIEAGNLFSKEYDQSLKVIGEVCNATAKTNQIIDYISKVKEDLTKRTGNIPETEQVIAYSGAMSFKGGHGIEGTYQNFPIFQMLHVKEIIKPSTLESTGVTIEKEKVLAANPPYIFLDPGNLTMVKNDYSQNPNYYRSLDAYKKGNIYSLPGYNFYYTNVEIALADCYYVGSVLYPEAFKDINPEKKAAEIFELFLGSKTYYKDMSKAGFAFGKMKIGE